MVSNEFRDAAEIEEQTPITSGVPRQRGWIPVTERLPEHYHSYPMFLGWSEKHRQHTCVFVRYRHATLWKTWPNMEDSDVTHWQPLPEGPGQ